MSQMIVKKAGLFMSERKWEDRKKLNIKDVKEFALNHNCSEDIATIFLKRGFDYDKFTAMVENFPYTLKDACTGVSIISEAIRNNEKIIIVNDYDVDGATSGFIMYECIKLCGGDVSVISPNRIIDGYGISKRIIDKAKEKEAKLIVTTDNGISAMEQIKYAKSLGFKVVITDHHEIPFTENEDGTKNYIIPPADAVINPKQIDCEYPFKEICGALVAYKVATLLMKEFIYDESKADYMIRRYKELACLGTICDVMPLEDENRTMVIDGLRLLKKTSFIGLKKLMEILNINVEKLSAYNIGYQIGPCINAVSRMTGSITLAMHLFDIENEKQAEKLANVIIDLNEKRKEDCKDIENSLDEKIKELEQKGDNIILLYIPKKNPAIMGIIAGRITEELNKPCVCFTDTENSEIIKGSGRSITGYDMFNEFSKYKELYETFGGHEGAIGISIQKKNLDKICETLNENAKKLNKNMFIKSTLVDLYKNADDVNLSFAKDLQGLEPFGEKNPPVVICQENARLTQIVRMGSEKKYARLTFINDRGGYYEAVMFNKVDDLDSLIKEKYSEDTLNTIYEKNTLNRKEISISFLYKASINSYRGEDKPQCIITDFRIQF